MYLILKRSPSVNGTTIGKLSLEDGTFLCYTLEDQIRVNEPKVYGNTAIPSGRYKVVITMSNRFKVALPLLLNVSNFEGVRIHAGNTKENTEGCILLGTSVSKNNQSINQSRIAMKKVMPLIEKALANGETVTLEIS